MDFTKDTSECSSSVGKSFSQDSINARILFKACRDAESKSKYSLFSLFGSLMIGFK